MRKSYKKLSVLLAVVMVICVFTTYTATAETLSTAPSLEIGVENGDEDTGGEISGSSEEGNIREGTQILRSNQNDDQVGIQGIFDYFVIEPVLKSVDINDDGTFTANWGYKCDLAVSIMIHPDSGSTVTAGPGGSISSAGTPPVGFICIR